MRRGKYLVLCSPTLRWIIVKYKQLSIYLKQNNTKSRILPRNRPKISHGSISSHLLLQNNLVDDKQDICREYKSETKLPLEKVPIWYEFFLQRKLIITCHKSIYMPHYSFYFFMLQFVWSSYMGSSIFKMVISSVRSEFNYGRTVTDMRYL